MAAQGQSPEQRIMQQEQSLHSPGHVAAAALQKMHMPQGCSPQPQQAQVQSSAASVCPWSPAQAVDDFGAALHARRANVTPLSSRDMRALQHRLNTPAAATMSPITSASSPKQRAQSALSSATLQAGPSAGPSGQHSGADAVNTLLNASPPEAAMCLVPAGCASEQAGDAAGAASPRHTARSCIRQLAGDKQRAGPEAASMRMAALEAAAAAAANEAACARREAAHAQEEAGAARGMVRELRAQLGAAEEQLAAVRKEEARQAQGRLVTAQPAQTGDSCRLQHLHALPQGPSGFGSVWQYVCTVLLCACQRVCAGGAQGRCLAKQRRMR